MTPASATYCIGQPNKGGTKDGGGILAVLVGGSSIGKTRALYEAVTECLPDWPLLAPRNSEELSRWLATDAVDRRTVLWLDEAQRFLPMLATELHHLLIQIPELAVVATMCPATGTASNPGPVARQTWTPNKHGQFDNFYSVIDRVSESPTGSTTTTFRGCTGWPSKTPESGLPCTRGNATAASCST